MLVTLDLGHVGRTGGRAGAVSRGLREDSIVVGYASRAAQRLIEAGITVELAGAGAYPARRRAARDVNSDAYLALHVNAGGGDYGLLLHLPDEASAALARHLASAMRSLGPRRWVVDVAGTPKWPEATSALLAGTGCASVLVEAGFLDNPAHDGMWGPTGQRAIGDAIATGVLAWGAP